LVKIGLHTRHLGSLASKGNVAIHCAKLRADSICRILVLP